jgi:caa(3)-type oxidase subunit IV
MSGNVEEVKQHIALYKKIGGALLVLTIVTVAVSYFHSFVPLALSIAIALVIAIVKGSLVASYFMHLIGERRSIYAALALTAFFFVVLLLIPILGHTDKVGVLKTLPNANAPAASHGEAH